MAGVVIPIQSTDAGREQVRSQLDNLGSQMSQLVQSYNQLRASIEVENKTELREQMRTLMDQRREAIKNLQDTWYTAKHSAEAQGIAVQNNIPALAGFRGLGQDDLGGLQTAVATEQSKLTVLTKYYTDAQAALAAGQPLPALPPELSTTTAGGGLTWLIVAALVIGVFFMGGNKS